MRLLLARPACIEANHFLLRAPTPVRRPTGFITTSALALGSSKLVISNLTQAQIHPDIAHPAQRLENPSTRQVIMTVPDHFHPQAPRGRASYTSPSALSFCVGSERSRTKRIGASQLTPDRIYVDMLLTGELIRFHRSREARDEWNNTIMGRDSIYDEHAIHRTATVGDDGLHHTF